MAKAIVVAKRTGKLETEIVHQLLLAHPEVIGKRQVAIDLIAKETGVSKMAASTYYHEMTNNFIINGIIQINNGTVQINN